MRVITSGAIPWLVSSFSMRTASPSSAERTLSVPPRPDDLLDLLELATLYLDQDPPPARALIETGVAVSVATDFNPGTAPPYDLPLASGRRLDALVTRR